jgi:hypothetical protein
MNRIKAGLGGSRCERNIRQSGEGKSKSRATSEMDEGSQIRGTETRHDLPGGRRGEQKEPGA